MPLSICDLVTYNARPDWGYGIVESVVPCLVVSFETPEGPYVGEFGEGEVKAADRAKATA